MRALQARFIAGFGPIVQDPRRSRTLYRDHLGIPFQEADGYLHTEKLPGAYGCALWPWKQAAQSCFGRPRGPRNLPRPPAWLEFEGDDVSQATQELKSRGYRLLVEDREEPSGQTVTRLLSPEGLLVGVTRTPGRLKRVPPR